MTTFMYRSSVEEASSHADGQEIPRLY